LPEPWTQYEHGLRPTTSGQIWSWANVGVAIAVDSGRVGMILTDGRGTYGENFMRPIVPIELQIRPGLSHAVNASTAPGHES
jgi:hypothetical protein